MATEDIASAFSWLHDIGAKRPMAPAGMQILVLGKWHAGHYPITCTRIPRKRVWIDDDEWHWMPAHDEWHLFGIPVAPLTRADIERILPQLAN